MLNNLSELAEDEEQVLALAKNKLKQFDVRKLKKALAEFGSAATKRRVNAWLSEGIGKPGAV